MKVLLVDAFGPNKKGRCGFNALKRALSYIIESHIPTASIVTRKCTEIGEYVHDWENESRANVAGKLNCLRFDELDLICVGGNMDDIRPWEPVFQDTILLLHMAMMVGRPILGTGVGAFAAVYYSATRGVLFNIINGPLGDPVEKLESYPRYYFHEYNQQLSSAPPRASLSGFLANDMGDIYEYLAKTKVWKPICNIGMNRKQSNHNSVLHASSLQRKNVVTIRSSQMPHLVDDAILENPFLKGLKSQSFELGSSSSWQLDRSSDQLYEVAAMTILAVDEEGHPMLFSHEKSRSLFTPCDIDEGIGFASMRIMLDNFCKYIQEDSKKISKNKIIDFIQSLDRESCTKKEMYLSAAAFPVASSMPSGALPVKLKSNPPLVAFDDNESEIFRQDLLDFIHDTESDTPLGPPLTRAPRLVVTPPESIDTVGYLERLQRSRNQSTCILQKQYDIGWKYPVLKMGEFRPPEPHQQESLTPWQQMSFDREVAERAAKGLAPPTSPLRLNNFRSQSNSLSSLDSAFEVSRSGKSLVNENEILEKRLKRLEKGIELSDTTPRTEEIRVDSRHLRTAGESSIRNLSRSTDRSPPKTRGKPIIHSVSTGSKFDINVSRSHLKASSNKSLSSLSLLAPTAQKIMLVEKGGLSNRTVPVQRDKNLMVVDVELRSRLNSNADINDADEVSLNSQISKRGAYSDADDVSLQSRSSL